MQKISRVVIRTRKPVKTISSIQQLAATQPKLATICSDHKINQLYNQLENAFDFTDNLSKTAVIPELSTTLSPGKKLKIRSKKVSAFKLDSKLANQIVDNDIQMSMVKRELTSVKNNPSKKQSTKLCKPYHHKTKSEPSQLSYKQLYKDFLSNKKSQDNSTLHLQQIMPEASPEGINYYSQLKEKQAIMQYTRSKIQQSFQREHQKMEKEEEHNKFILQLYRRKYKNRKQGFHITEKWEKQLYNSQIKNIDKIGNRLRKIYTRTTKSQITQKAQERISKSPILKAQRQILDQINFGDSKHQISKESKAELIKKFSLILRQITKLQRKKVPHLNDRAIKSVPKSINIRKGNQEL